MSLKSNRFNRKIQSLVISSFLNGVNAVQPYNVFKKCVRKDLDRIVIQNKQIAIKNAYIVGFGKAAGCMVMPLYNILESIQQNGVKRTILSVPFGFEESMKDKEWYVSPLSAGIEMYEGAKDNLPDESAVQSTEKIINLVKGLSSNDTVFVLISGGGSALLPMPLDGLSLDQKILITKQLFQAGANIDEINTVRRSLSAVKGGKLAQCTNARIVSLIISDNICDDLLTIASGPTVPNTDCPEYAINILNKYRISVDHKLSSIINGNLQSSDCSFDHVTNFLVANNYSCLEAVKEYITKQDKLPTLPIILTSKLQGEASHVGTLLATLGLNILDYFEHRKNSLDITSNCEEVGISVASTEELLKTINNQLNSNSNSICLIFGGEPTVVIKGDGKGGRNQELVLSASIKLKELSKRKQPIGNIMLISGGTDGIDGPTDAAGAVTYYTKSSNSSVRLQTTEAAEESLNPSEFLANNNSYEYFRQLANGSYHLKTGHTGTNVMDIIILFISKESFEGD